MLKVWPALVGSAGARKLEAPKYNSENPVIGV